jgi:hypothetical protein
MRDAQIAAIAAQLDKHYIGYEAHDTFAPVVAAQLAGTLIAPDALTQDELLALADKLETTAWVARATAAERDVIVAAIIRTALKEMGTT